jgi:CheY-like chemotaxis protein
VLKVISATTAGGHRNRLEASDGDSHWRAERPDVIVSDIRMPGIGELN